MACQSDQASRYQQALSCGLTTTEEVAWADQVILTCDVLPQALVKVSL